MSSKSPVFPMPEPQHYSDYGFDPQIDYFQVLEEARRHGRRAEARSPDGPHLKIRKPISKDDRGPKSKQRRHWWKSALLFWKRDKGGSSGSSAVSYPRRVVSGPVYMTESCQSTPCRTSRPVSGPLRVAEVVEVGMPYLSLRDLSLAEGHRSSASRPPHVPLYLVT